MFILEEKEDSIFISLNKEQVNNLGILHYIDLVNPGRVLQTGEVFGTIETSNTVLSLEAPFDCIIEEVNENLLLLPKNIYSDNLDENWFIRVHTF